MSASELRESTLCIRVSDWPEYGQSETSGPATERADWCCRQLEQGRVIMFDALPFDLPEAERQFLLSQQWDDSRLHKNISYRPAQDLLRGFSAEDAATTQRLHQFMRSYSNEALKFLSHLLSPYAPHWITDYASFRPKAEQGRKLPTRKRNDLLHVDAFPSRPTRGARILRCFTNINPAQPRVWQTTDDFAALAEKYAGPAGLARFADGNHSRMRNWAQTLKQQVGLQPKGQSAYDRFMLQFHDYLKEDVEFQQNCSKIQLEFPPGGTWICFTDAVPHAVTFGQYALEQTVIVPLSAMLTPERSPLRILETLAGKPLV